MTFQRVHSESLQKKAMELYSAHIHQFKSTMVLITDEDRYLKYTIDFNDNYTVLKISSPLSESSFNAAYYYSDVLNQKVSKIELYSENFSEEISFDLLKMTEAKLKQIIPRQDVTSPILPSPSLQAA